MAISGSHPMRFTAKGLTDAFDATDEFHGACTSLANLIFDQSNPELSIPRPGVELINAVGNGFISVQVSIGTRTYGMIASSAIPGFDQPFCFDSATGAAVPIGGFTGANTPVSPATTGAWEPPTMASIGVFIIVTHPGFSGVGANFFGVIDLTNPAVPVWSSSNTATNPLTARPSAVANLNNRAYFAVGNQLQFSDPLAPKTRTSATQALVLGDSAPIVALSGLPIQTTSSGIVGALIAWKQTQLWQVTGDPANTPADLALNFMSLTVGTNSPRSIAQSPAGLYFLSTAGPYFIDPVGTLRSLTSQVDSSEPDIQTAFINMITPTRWAGAYNSSVYRVCGPTELFGQAVTNDYWFDEHKRRWNGPHTFAYDCASAMAGRFVLSSALNPGLLISSTSYPTLSSVYTDLGSTYNVNMDSSTFPKVGDMSQKMVCESQIELGGKPIGGATYTITAKDEGGNVLDTVVITVAADAVPVWGGGGLWGDGSLWTGTQSKPPRTYAVPWTKPLIFEKMALSISSPVGANLQIGTFYARYQKTGYMTRGPTP